MELFGQKVRENNIGDLKAGLWRIGGGVLIDLETHDSILIDGERESQRIDWVVVGLVFGKELGGQVTIGDGDLIGEERAVAGVPGSGAFAERGLIAVAKLFFLP